MPVSTAAAAVTTAAQQPRQKTTQVCNNVLSRPSEFSLRPCDLSRCTRKQILDYFENTYSLDEFLFSSIVDEQFLFKCPDRLRLPLIFYFAHPATLYINKLILAGLISNRVNAEFEKVFETGVDEMCWDDTENYRMGGAYKWPGVSKVMEYRNTVKQLLIEIISSTTLPLPVSMDDSYWWSIFMGMEHERIHIETSSVLIRQLPVDYVQKPSRWLYAPLSMDTPAGDNVLVTVPAGRVSIGKPRDFPSYGWDNEYGNLEMDVPEFEASQYLVTNGEFLEFVESRGYQKREFWTTEGWQWLQYRGARHPSFWVCAEGCRSGCGADLSSYSHCNLPEHNSVNGLSTTSQYRYRAMFDILDMPLDWPVDVNYHEAKAFCAWKGPLYRLPTEAEHHRIRGDPPPSSDPSCDPIFSSHTQANINFKYGSSSPVNMFPANAMGFFDVYGNVWEWLEDQFNGLPSFKTHYLYDDFSAPCFDGRHTMITGGSWISTGDEASRFARFSFRRHFFQHLGFRVVRSTSSAPPPVRLCAAQPYVIGVGVTENPVTIPGVEGKGACVPTTNRQFDFETTQKMEEMLQQQYSQVEQYGIPVVKLVEETVRKCGVNTRSAINFGCGTGLTSFLLSQTFQEVVGIDFCGRFVDAAVKIQEGKVLPYSSQEVARLPSEADPQRVQFKQLTWVPNELKGFDMAVFECPERLAEPRGWLYKLWEVLCPKAVAVFCCSSWDRERLLGYTRQWFLLVEEATVGGVNIFILQRK